MSGFRLTKRANKDLDDIDDYLSQEAGDDTAEMVTGRILEACDRLSKRPGMGHRREDLTDRDVRFWSVYSYLVIYRERQPLEVLRIWSGRQNPEDLDLE